MFNIMFNADVDKDDTQVKTYLVGLFNPDLDETQVIGLLNLEME